MNSFNVGEISQKTLASLGVDTWFEKQTTSTNMIAKNEAQKVNSSLKVYLSNHQTEGRGRNQNLWTDLDHGSALLSSWSYTFKKSPQPILAPLVGLAIINNLTKYFPTLAFSLKAPNDILIGKAKLSGILIENVLNGTQGRCIIGIGMNVFKCPSGLEATHLSQHIEVFEKIWGNFLNNLKEDLYHCVITSEQSTLSPDACLAIARALRKNPRLTDELIQVTPNGSLIFKNKKIDWQSL